jgi:hypothetical protein
MRWWVLGEFSSEKSLLEAIAVLRREGFNTLDAHTPIPVEGLSEALGLPPSRLPFFALGAGLSGAALGYGLQWFTNAIDWPLNVGGRPPHSALTNIPITFETAVLVAAASIFFALFALMALPRLSHPVFAHPHFESASIDGFWVSLATTDEAIRERGLVALRKLGARHIDAVQEPQ